MVHPKGARFVFRRGAPADRCRHLLAPSTEAVPETKRGAYARANGSAYGYCEDSARGHFGRTSDADDEHADTTLTQTILADGTLVLGITFDIDVTPIDVASQQSPPDAPIAVRDFFTNPSPS